LRLRKSETREIIANGAEPTITVKAIQILLKTEALICQNGTTIDILRPVSAWTEI
jgi:hypothetical protein